MFRAAAGAFAGGAALVGTAAGIAEVGWPDEIVILFVLAGVVSLGASAPIAGIGTWRWLRRGHRAIEPTGLAIYERLGAYEVQGSFKIWSNSPPRRICGWFQRGRVVRHIFPLTLREAGPTPRGGQQFFQFEIERGLLPTSWDGVSVRVRIELADGASRTMRYAAASRVVPLR